jgi:hypothetical protein
MFQAARQADNTPTRKRTPSNGVAIDMAIGDIVVKS